jgi:tetratricopeptide (TPR) repeat protein
MKKYLIAILLLPVTSVWAQLPHGITPAEQAMCQARVYSRLGERNQNTMHMHHYCNGLRFLDRAYSAMGGKKQDMSYYLTVSINEFDYVLKATQESYAMRGEVHLNRARALKLLGRNAEAAGEFNKALRYRLDTPDLYQALADHFHEVGNKQKALEMATEGLKLNPNSKGLKRRYTEFGGKLPYPVAVEESISTEASKEDIKSVDKSESPPPSEGATSQVTDPTKLTAPTEPTSQIDPSKIGSPQNPYCRFCPD